MLFRSIVNVAGKATLTMERSREAMNAPRAVTTKMVRCREVVVAALAPSGVDSVMKLTLGHCVASCNSLTPDGRWSLSVPPRPPLR